MQVSIFVYFGLKMYTQNVIEISLILSLNFIYLLGYLLSG